MRPQSGSNGAPPRGKHARNVVYNCCRLFLLRSSMYMLRWLLLSLFTGLCLCHRPLYGASWHRQAITKHIIQTLRALRRARHVVVLLPLPLMRFVVVVVVVVVVVIFAVFVAAVSSCSLFAVRCPLLVVRCSLFPARCSLFAARCSVLASRCSLLAVRCFCYSFSYNLNNFR